MENRDYLIILYDYYGEILKEENRKYFEDYYFDNLSLQEIAEKNDISRNAVHKHIKSVEAKLVFYEEKLKLYEKEKTLSERIKNIKDVNIRKEIEKIIE